MTLTQLNKTLQEIASTTYQSYTLRLLLATLMSGGKLMQAAALNAIGLNAFLAKFSTLTPEEATPIVMFFIFINMLVTGATRISELYNYFLPAQIKLPPIYLTAELISESSNFPEGYLLCLEDEILYKKDNAAAESKIVVLGAEDQQLLQLLIQAIHEKDPLSNSDFMADGDPYRLIDKILTAEHLVLFKHLNVARPLLIHRTLTASRLYAILYVICCCSVPIASINSYLLGNYFVAQFTRSIEKNVQLSIGLFVLLCSTVSYLNFNLPKMKKGIQNLCLSIDEGLLTGNYGIPKKAMELTIALTFFGIIANVGLAIFYRH